MVDCFPAFFELWVLFSSGLKGSFLRPYGALCVSGGIIMAEKIIFL